MVAVDRLLKAAAEGEDAESLFCAALQNVRNRLRDAWHIPQVRRVLTAQEVHRRLRFRSVHTR